MADYKANLISDVTTSLVSQLDYEDINIVADEMYIALKNYEVTKVSTEIVKYDGINEDLLKRYKACLLLLASHQTRSHSMNEQ